MRKGIFLKVLQRHTYTCLSHQYGIYFAFAGVVIVMYSMFQFGEELLEWSQGQYDSLFSLFHDNIAAKSFQTMISAPIPIDVVYTWVNGSDPILLSQLNSLKKNLNTNDLTNATAATNSRTIRDVQCQFKDCFQLPCLVANPSFGKLTLSEVQEKYKDQLINLKWIKEFEVANGVVSEAKQNVSMLRFENKDKATEAITKLWSSNTSDVQFAFVTSDEEAPYSTLLPHGLLLSDVPDKMNSEDLRGKLPTPLKEITDWIHIVSDKHLALVWTTDAEMTHKMLHAKDNSSIRSFAIDSKIVLVTPAFMVITIEEQTEDDLARSRFEDNEELRFSLRSVEKYAPWVRKIFIVTNGQIPYWLNLDNPRISVVSHEEIFSNMSHLPTFSSPAIETHIHKIPGLAKKFIYMNDDVMFGKEVWPDDFYTHSFGQKVYLTWPVPNCAEGCAPSWIKDGYCDSACNISECNWDGGDCTGSNVRTGVGSNFGGAYSYSLSSYCQPGCANSWLADKFCDQSCNKEQCGFDAADCGISNYDKMYKIPFTLTNNTNYVIPDGLKNGYIDISKFFDKITSAEYDTNSALRTAAVSNKYHVMTIVYQGIANKTNSRFKLSGEISKENEKGDANKTHMTVMFNITAFPSKNATVNVTQLHMLEEIEKNKQEEIEPVLKSSRAIKSSITPEYMDIIGVADDIKKPKSPTHSKITDQDVVFPSEINETVLPANVSKKLKALGDELKEEILTEAGYMKKRKALLLPYLSLLEGILPRIKIPDDSLLPRNDGEVGKDLRRADDAGKPLKIMLASIEKKVERDFSAKSHEHIKGDLGLVKGDGNTATKQDQRKRSKLKDSQLKNPFYRMVKTQIEKGKLQLNDSGIVKPEVFSKRKLLGLKMDDVGVDYHLNRILHNQPARGIQNQGFLPWERKMVFDEAVAKQEETDSRKNIMKLYEVETPKLRTGRRKPLDTFADSLRFVSHLYNRDFGFMQRKVPAHMPHFIDVDIMSELQAMYPHEYDITSSHKLRHSKDMQFAFSYNYFILSVKKSVKMKEIFKSLDTDGSGVLSDREIRVLATKTHDLPLTLNELTKMEKNLISCAWKLYGPQKLEEGNNTEVIVGDREDLLQPTESLPAWARTENYYDKNLPLVTEHLVLNCPYIVDLINKTYGGGNKYKHEVMEQEEIAFKMIRTNVSTVVGQLDDIRKNPKKFICLNDNIDHHKTKEADMIKAVLRDFYETLFPKESQFELGPEYRNRFLDMKSLQEWRAQRDHISSWLRMILFILMLTTCVSMTWDRMHPVFRRNRHRLFRRCSKLSNFFWKLLEKHKARGKTASV